MSTKTTRNYFRMIAIDYLNDILTPLILEILKNPKGFEIDPRYLYRIKIMLNKLIEENFLKEKIYKKISKD